MSERYPIVSCRICGKQDEACYMEPTKSSMVDKQLCFVCLFWVEQAAAPAGIRIDGKHYRVDRNESSPFKGFGGHRFTIKMNDGTVIQTTNLWMQGEIPEAFRHLLPDNAEFVWEPSRPVADNEGKGL